MRYFTSLMMAAALAFFAVACTTDDGTAGGAGGGDTTSPPADTTAPDTANPADTSPVDTTQPDYGSVPLQPDDQAFLQQFQALLEDSVDMSYEQLVEAYGGTATYLASLSYDPLPNEYLELIDEAYTLNTNEKDALTERGFFVTDRVSYESHPMGYMDLFQKDLPVLITTDSILFAIHKSYDLMLKKVEEQALIPMLDAMLTAAHQALADVSTSDAPAVLADAVRDVDLFYTVARSLLLGDMVAPLDDANLEARNELLDQVEALDPKLIELFGRVYPCAMPGCAFDFSQFKPRGHYTETEELQRYFKAMIWLGRTELALTRYHRELVVSALMAETLEVASQVDEWTAFDETIQVFVGKSDNLTMTQFKDFLAEQEVAKAGMLADAAKGEAVMKALEVGGYGMQRIMSQIMATNPLSSEPTLLPPIFAFLGQRFVIDSYVFHNVTYDRIVFEGQKIQRYMPDPLDAAFVLGYDQVLPLLEDELERYHYAQNLQAVRFLADSHDQSFWSESMYNVWLDALRALADVPTGPALPEAMKTEGYALKAVNTGLASWAELRHDTILYVKQSYTGVACDYPDGYVEPYPAFFNRVGAFATRSGELFATLEIPTNEWFKAQVQQYFDNLAEVAAVLENIANKQLLGEPRSPDETAFIKSLVQFEGMCGGPMFTGWYSDLFFDANDETFQFKPTIADVHTDPNSTNVLHVGTGRANLMVLSVNTDCGTKTYAGPASSYYEVLQSDFKRHTDEEWKEIMNGDTLPDRPEWTKEFLVR